MFSGDPQGLASGMDSETVNYRVELRAAMGTVRERRTHPAVSGSRLSESSFENKEKERESRRDGAGSSALSVSATTALASLESWLFHF